MTDKVKTDFKAITLESSTVLLNTLIFKNIGNDLNKFQNELEQELKINQEKLLSIDDTKTWPINIFELLFNTKIYSLTFRMYLQSYLEQNRPIFEKDDYELHIYFSVEFKPNQLPSVNITTNIIENDEKFILRCPHRHDYNLTPFINATATTLKNKHYISTSAAYVFPIHSSGNVVLKNYNKNNLLEVQENILFYETDELINSYLKYCDITMLQSIKEQWEHYIDEVGYKSQLDEDEINIKLVKIKESLEYYLKEEFEKVNKLAINNPGSEPSILLNIALRKPQLISSGEAAFFTIEFVEILYEGINNTDKLGVATTLFISDKIRLYPDLDKIEFKKSASRH